VARFLTWSSIVLALSAIAPAEELAVGARPPADAIPRIEFVFEERVTIAAPVVMGETLWGHRQYIPITGGTVDGPRLKGQVVPGGWDFQLNHADSKCTELSADYFLKAEDGALIHVVNHGLFCPGARGIFRPRLEAPKGKHEWMTRATFVATLEIETPKNSGDSPAPAVEAVRIRFYQVL
jgi:hypothetical protein